ncbi:MAG TPA: type II toxin-antitoxin system RatA family toxin [Gammaproteobacteria bacterium]|nr:type II toxin-antitoxin system RatA family toxin [Gammaproteobacteria bacterium]
MQKIYKSALVPYSAPQMFDLVNNFQAYPEFLPWCLDARVESRADDEVHASLRFGRGAVSRWFTTLNRLHEPDRIDIRLVNGPFRHLEGHWSFTPLGEEGSKIEVNMEFEFANALVGMAFGPIFSEVCNTLVSSFTRRANTVYGQ